MLSWPSPAPGHQSTSPCRDRAAPAGSAGPRLDCAVCGRLPHRPRCSVHANYHDCLVSKLASKPEYVFPEVILYRTAKSDATTARTPHIGTDAFLCPASEASLVFAIRRKHRSGRYTATMPGKRALEEQLSALDAL